MTKKIEELINQNDGIVTIESQLIHHELVFNNDWKARGIVFKKCTFHNDVIFEEINFNCGIKFIDCSFKKSMSICNCILDGYDNNFNLEGVHLHFTGSSIESLRFLGNNQIERGVLIDKQSVIGRLDIRTINSKSGGFSIHNSEVNNLFDVSQGKYHGSFQIRHNSTIRCKLRFENLEASDISFTESTFEKDIHIWAGQLNGLIFNDGIFEDELHIKAVKFTQNVSIIGANFKKAIIFDLLDKSGPIIGSLKEVYISTSTFGEQLAINGNGVLIEKLTINFSKKLIGAMYFNSCLIKSSHIRGDNHNGNLVFNQCNFNNLIISYFYNYSSFSLISAQAFEVQSALVIEHSNLGKTQLFNASLESFENITIKNSSITEIVTSNVIWFNSNKLNHKDIQTKYDYAQKREVFRQLKYALEKQGNRADSLLFKSLEMSSFKMEVFSGQNWFRSFFSVNGFILWIGKTNNFGSNWVKPLWQILVFSLIFYSLIIIDISTKLDYTLNVSKESFKITFNELWNYIDCWPQLMNPTHYVDRVFINVSDISFVVHLWDYVLKIFLAFYIFQIISAFRKYMK